MVSSSHRGFGVFSAEQLSASVGARFGRRCENQRTVRQSIASRDNSALARTTRVRPDWRTLDTCQG
ncbi:hypothetical protein [Natrinema hispanicum]|uniref:hypothetical protein n=1 Tax=Natrinema hispanicum TaxID=392421 RepID=UPI00102C3F10|nr:hypothetical protein [Natrinema hispanicum]